MARKTTEIRLAEEADQNAQRLTPLDLALLLASQARAERAERDMQVAYLRHNLAQVQKELDVLRMSEKYRLLDAATSQSIESAKHSLAGKTKAHNEMTAQMGEKYGIDWSNSAYNEDTGVISSVPKE